MSGPLDNPPASFNPAFPLVFLADVFDLDRLLRVVMAAVSIPVIAFGEGELDGIVLELVELAHTLSGSGVKGLFEFFIKSVRA